MSFSSLLRVYFFLCLIVVSETAQAQNPPPSTGTLSLGLGYYEVFEHYNKAEAVDLRAEYRSNTPIFWKLKPWGGAELTTDATFWIGGGVLADCPIAKTHWSVTPSFGAGYYARGHSQKTLNYPLQFRTQLEVGYALPKEHKVSVAIAHISNGNLGSDNPGTETISAYYHIPLKKGLFEKLP